MGWLVFGVWTGALVLAVLALGFCVYELTWKSRRLRTDLDRLAGLSETLTAMQADVEDVQRRLADSTRAGR